MRFKRRLYGPCEKIFAVQAPHYGPGSSNNRFRSWQARSNLVSLGVSALLQAADIDSEETFGVNMNDRLRHLQRLGQQLFALRFHAFPQD